MHTPGPVQLQTVRNRAQCRERGGSQHPAGSLSAEVHMRVQLPLGRRTAGLLLHDRLHLLDGARLQVLRQGHTAAEDQLTGKKRDGRKPANQHELTSRGLGHSVYFPTAKKKPGREWATRLSGIPAGGMAAGVTPGRLLGIMEATEPAARSFAAPDGRRESAVAAKLNRRCLGLGFNRSEEHTSELQ